MYEFLLTSVTLTFMIYLRSTCNFEEVVDEWCVAQELNTVQHAFMNVVIMLCGQVLFCFIDTKTYGLIENHLERQRGS
jgi:hypothetical protein